MQQLSIKKRLFTLPLFLLFFTIPSFLKIKKDKIMVIAEKESLYKQLHLSEFGLSQVIFDKAMAGWNVMIAKKQLTNSSLLSIVDFSQSSNTKRLYVIDVDRKVLLLNTYVAHGRNSGGEYATYFGNKVNSFKSSLGFYITGETYQGNHGLSLRLKGVEKGINDDAEERGIVLHGAPYVSEAFIKQCGRLGRSQGCPAVPQELCKEIIGYIKQGSCFYMYYPDENYLKHTLLG